MLLFSLVNKFYKAMQYIIAQFVNFYGATVLLQLQNVILLYVL